MYKYFLFMSLLLTSIIGVGQADTIYSNGLENFIYYPQHEKIVFDNFADTHFGIDSVTAISSVAGGSFVYLHKNGQYTLLSTNPYLGQLSPINKGYNERDKDFYTITSIQKIYGYYLAKNSLKEPVLVDSSGIIKEDSVIIPYFINKVYDIKRANKLKFSFKFLSDSITMEDEIFFLQYVLRYNGHGITLFLNAEKLYVNSFTLKRKKGFTKVIFESKPNEEPASYTEESVKKVYKIEYKEAKKAQTSYIDKIIDYISQTPYYQE